MHNAAVVPMTTLPNATHIFKDATRNEACRLLPGEGNNNLAVQFNNGDIAYTTRANVTPIHPLLLHANCLYKCPISGLYEPALCKTFHVNNWTNPPQWECNLTLLRCQSPKWCPRNRVVDYNSDLAGTAW